MCATSGVCPNQEIMPSDPRKKSSVASYFDDDDDDIKPAVSSSTRRASRQPRAAAGGGVARGAQEERVSEPGLSMFDKHKTADGDWEHDKTDRRHGGWERGHEAAAAARNKKKSAKSPKSINKKALRESLKEAKLSLNMKLHKCDEFIIQRPTWKGSGIIEEIAKQRKKFNEILHEGKEEWFRKNKAEYDQIEEHRAKKLPNPHKGIHKERVIFMHGLTVKFSGLDDLAKDVAKFVKEHGVYSAGGVMPSPKPKEAVEGQHRYYVYNALRYLAREKYQMIESIHKIIHEKMDSHQGTAQGTEYRAFLDLLKHIKQAKETVDSLEDQIRANSHKKKQDREHWALPDDGFLPKQVSAGGD